MGKIVREYFLLDKEWYCHDDKTISTMSSK